MEMKWISKQETYSTADISLRIYKSHGKPIAGIIFRDKANFAISSNGYVQVAILNNRLYFRKSDEKNGYKMSLKNYKSGIGKTAVVRIVDADLYDFCKKNEGNYTLLYDKEKDLYFVENKK